MASFRKLVSAAGVPRLIFATAGAATLFVGTSARGAIYYSAGFDPPAYSQGALVGQDSWAVSSGAGVNALQVSAAGTVALTTSGEDDTRVFTTVAGTAGTSVYLGSSATISAAQATGDYFLNLASGGSFGSRVYAKSSGTGYLLGVGSSSGTATYGTTELPFNTAVNIVVRYDFVTGALNDVATLYVNPADTVTEASNTPYATSTGAGTDLASVTAVNVRQGSTTQAPTGAVDYVIVSSDFTSATTVPAPEPTAIALLLPAGLLALRRPRRRD